MDVMYKKKKVKSLKKNILFFAYLAGLKYDSIFNIFEKLLVIFLD